ncbi:MAG: Folylpolyglutamate synthase [Pelotomaculum thermopropionicum]|uniref:tetrahydrofolate synthase n=1 Tax=Pelotomaculum thermopropionicum TaxID=110500 RepID=A0A101HSK6_9FIRM|nr:MAG: Folylpolyglutamate synthase [Pelotomaculum thermopropionicum]
MNYEEAMNYLADLARFGFNFGLGRIEELLNRLGNPHRYLSTVHIGGTNGKGSTAAMLASVLVKAGYRVGIFTSPHLHSFTERYRVNGREITPEKLAELVGELRPYMETMVTQGFEHPTQFEAATALAFLYFYREKVDFLVLEVGLGGAIDSTNVVLPLASVITNIGMDHMNYLGNTIAEIAGIKTGIIKPGIPVVTAAEGKGLAVVEQVCREKDARLILVGRDVTWKHIGHTGGGQVFFIRGRQDAYENLFLPLLGRHQQVNAATAVAAAEILMEAGYAVSPEAVRKGLAAVNWPGRLEIVREDPLVIIDGAHNYDGARSLRRALKEYLPGKNLVLMIGMLGDKDHARVLSELAVDAGAVVVTKPDNPRAANWKQLAVEAGRYSPEVYLLEDIGAAVAKALSLAGPDDVVCITGSLYMIAKARKILLM